MEKTRVTGGRARGMFFAILAAGGLFVVTGCDKKPDPPVTVAPSATELPPSKPPPTSMNMKWDLDPKSKAMIDMPAPKEHIKATTDAAVGELDVDLMNLANTRGEVKMDLTTLTTKTFDDEDQNKKQTTHARTWLEVADGEDGPLPDEVKKNNRYAVYAIRSVDNVSASDITKVAPTKDGNEDVRTVTATTHGELLIHQHKVDRTADVEIQFRYPTGGPADKPTSMVVKTKKPLRVLLAEHEVKPRDGVGKIAKRAFSLIGTKVAETADIELELRAKPHTM